MIAEVVLFSLHRAVVIKKKSDKNTDQLEINSKTMESRIMKIKIPLNKH